MKRDKLMARVAWLLAIAAFTALAPQMARAVDGKEVVAGGGEISFTGATEKSWITNPDGSQDLLLIFSDPATKGSFTFPGMTEARILAVGGGGGGAGMFGRGNQSPFGGAGGGGAGGFVETNDMFTAGTYAVTIGKGGEGGAKGAAPTSDFSGKDGEATEIVADEAAEPLVSAKGGGGGGGNTLGRAGGSGGGGSQTSVGEQKNGGSGIPGQGNAGGKGNVVFYGGGGGGAGSEGDAANAGAKGGKGKPSSITGSEVWYAGGGGGGYANRVAGSAIAGGQGGGGYGGYGSSVDATGGTDGLGGGGGGAGPKSYAGGKGGCGVVVVRVSGAISGGLVKPTDLRVKYDGKEHVSYETSPFYTVTGQNVGTNVGVYVATVTPKPGIQWEDETSDAVSVTMMIYDGSSMSGEVQVTGARVQYFGVAETNWVDGDLLLKFTGAGSFTLPGTSKAQILAIGGGGGGAGMFGRGYQSPFGGPGGGGAGGFVETNAFLAGATYSVNVGAGGAGGLKSSSPSADFSGKNGSDTVIRMMAVEWLTAYGGGGGGGNTTGRNGASGGGGSQNSSGTPAEGGNGISGQGNGGGSGKTTFYGGGGGGAGAPGDAATAGGKGGKGKPSFITGSEVWYAGGGGGGYANRTAGSSIAGGQGGGGAGGWGSSTNAEDGTDGLGGGGGGAGPLTFNGGKGGNGVVYVRISAAMSGELTKPEKIQNYTYDGNAHTSVVESAFYEISGPTIGTDVGTYEASVTLKPGFSWPGDDTESPVNVKMTIAPCTVTISDFKLADWTYTTLFDEMPDPTYAIDPAWVKPLIEYAESEDAPEGDWTTEKIFEAGTHWVRARLADTKNFVANSAKTSYTVSPVAVTFKDLFQKDWMEGTPDEETPRPRCTVTPAWVQPKYQYAATEDAPEEDWLDTKPTALGTWAIRILAPDAKNYTYTPATASFAIVKGRGGTFVDYVDITIDGYTGANPSVLSNYVYKITLSEELLPGFLYSRAGEDGNEMGFTDAKGEDLKYRVGDWNKYGESVVYVQIPEIGNDPQTIRLYWCLRTGATAPEHDPASVVPGEEKAIGYTTDLVVRNGYEVNYWIRQPSLTRLIWPLGGTKGTLVAGRLAKGTYSQKVVKTLTGEESPYPPTEGGAFRYVFTLDNPDLQFEPLEYHIDFAVTTSNPMDELGGAVGDLTINGRVMIANDDSAPGYAVTGQSYWHTDPEVETVWWEHGGEHKALSAYPNLRRFPGNTHRLNYLDDEGRTNLLWRMNEVILGNTFDAEKLEGVRCFLPWSSTGLGLENGSAKPGTRDESGWMVMRNTKNAVIYSPCYTNGIGTIYFDALNVYGITAAYDPETFAIEVDIATNVYDEATPPRSLPPTDANCRGLNEFDVEDEFGRLRESRWTTVKMIPLKRDNNEKNFTLLPETDHLPLDIAKCASTNNFYRVCVPVDVTGPVRFRIRRAGEQSGALPDGRYGYIALDNILVSYPKSTANLRPHGTFDASKGGKRVIGQEGAFSVPFLAVDEGEVYGGATNDLYVSDVCKTDPRELVLLSRLHYRWRYADQETKAWRTLDMSPFDNYRTVDPLKLEHEEGDLEFWYESFLNVPFYTYHDYSGAGVGLGGLYTEEVTTVTNRIDKKAYANFTGPGDDWFVRFRAGRCDWDEFSVVVSGAYSANQPMELIGDHTWRGLVKVPTNATGKVTFWFVGNCRRGEWGRLVESDRWRFPAADVGEMPSRGDTVASKTGCGYEADGASNYVEFQFNDETGTYTIGHAEYQTFNAWHDAHREDGKFVGNFAETSGVSVATMVETNAHISTWNLHKTTDANWDESFEMTNYEDPGYPKNTPDYIDHKMPHQWVGAEGLFVDATLTDSNQTAKTKSSGIAWQMRGRGLGSVSLTPTDAKDVPAGLDTISFKARLAQGVSFEDFSVWDGDGSTKAKDYTFVFPAVMSAANGNDCAPGATMSLVGYYRARRGCYEFRVERMAKDGLMFSIYKWWAKDGDEIVPECLAQQWFKGATFIQNSTKPNMYAMFISVGEELENKTSIIAGLSTTAAQPNGLFSGSAYRVIYCVDEAASRLTAGGFGVLSRNCQGLFMDPRHYLSYRPQNQFTWKTPVNPPNPAYKGYAESATVNYPTAIVKDMTLIDPDNDNWGYTPARIEYGSLYYSNTYTAYGMRAPTDLAQTVGVYLKPARGNFPWTLYDEVSVSKYAFNDKPFEVVVRTNESCHVMLKSGAKLSDVTVWQIAQTAWRGEDLDNIDSISRDFVYTQTRIADEVSTGAGGAKATNRVAVLQPARALATRPLSIRSPLLDGLGMAGFSYKDVKPGAEVWVQVATNNAANGLSGTGGYNESVKSVELGEDEPEGTWITVRKFGYDELAGASAQTYYLGWHNHLDDPLKGVFRLFVPTNVVEEAGRRVKTEPEYGSITITDFYVHSEPALDTKSWIGWNLRTVGDATDSEKRMYLPDMSAGGDVGLGLSMGLNNSTTADVVGDPSLYDKVNPTVQSPTFGRYVVGGETRYASIGQVRFRARVYEPGQTAKIALYGTRDGSAEDWGAPLTNFVLTSTRYSIFEYQAPSRNSFAAMRLVVDGVKEGVFGTKRVLIDEVVVSEKNDAAIGFHYARPFRTGLDNDLVVDNILEKEQQPLCDESWGVQTKLKFDTFGNEIDLERGFEVKFQYYVGDTPWGYANWCTNPAASQPVSLRQVGSKADYVFRSTALDRASIVPPQRKANTVVQYALTVYYYEKGNPTKYDKTLAVTDVEGDGWTNPRWYSPIDLNREANGDWKRDTAPYTLLDTISPGRAWINEVNYNDGPDLDLGEDVNQFIEIAIPSDVDLTDWTVRMTDKNLRSQTIARFGSGIPARKKTTDGSRSGDYEFFVLQSPNTAKAGGIRDPEHPTKAVADGTWAYAADSGLSFQNGSFNYGHPYQLELVRPSGVVEHQFVIEGTNTWRLEPEYYKSFGYQYDGTNLLAELDRLYPLERENRFFAGSELAHRPSAPATLASFGVTGAAHGEAGGWSGDMALTPGRRNDGQDDLVGWYIHPSGGSCWVYARVVGDRLRQRIGDDTSPDTFVIVNRDSTTNIQYTLTSPWAQIDAVTVNGVTNSEWTGRRGTLPPFTVGADTDTVYVVATEGLSRELVDVGRLDLKDPYSPAILRWLDEGSLSGTFKNPSGPLTNATFLGTWSGATNITLSLKSMYWMDIDPTDPGWWLRGGTTAFVPDAVTRTITRDDGTVETCHNAQIRIKMYLSNEVSGVTYAPYRLQGLANEKSDLPATYPQGWTSETFKVRGFLQNGRTDINDKDYWLPFRLFVFGGTKGSSLSFANDGAEKFTSQIEIIDPFSSVSPGMSYQWWRYPGSSFLMSWDLSERIMPVGVETLKADSTYEGKPPFAYP